VPYAPGETSRSVVAVAYSIKLERLPPYVVAGREVSFEGSLTVDGRPAPRETVKIKRCLYERPQECVDVMTLTTGAMGEFYDTWRPTHDLACRRYYFYAEHPASGAKSESQVVAVAYPTRVTVEAPGTVTAGQAFEVRGRLEYEASLGRWAGLGYRRVHVYLNGSKVAEATTAADGSYSVRITISRPGTYTLRVVFPGEGLPAAQVAATDVAEYLPSLLGSVASIAVILAPLVASLL
jgi:hypothetical protein